MDGAEQGDDDHQGAEDLDRASRQPVKNDTEYFGGLRVVATLRGSSRCRSGIHHQPDANNTMSMRSQGDDKNAKDDAYDIAPLTEAHRSADRWEGRE